MSELEGIDSATILELFTDPVKWCEAFLRNPNNKEEPLKFISYQKEVLENTVNHRNIITCWGRRSGKSVTMCADTLWWCGAWPLVRMIRGETKKQLPFRVIIATPYDTQINELWTTYAALIADSPLLSSLVKKIRSSDPQTIEFENGSTIEGHTIGISSSNKGTSMRSLSADMIFLDEMDYIPREIIEQVIMPIWTTHAECRLRICSTPSGKRELFWEWFTKAEELGWFRSHHPSWHPDNNRWLSIAKAQEQGKPITESTEFQVKAITPSDTYAREYGAEFGEEFGGVYKQTQVDRSLIKYGREVNIVDPDVFDPGFQQTDGNMYIIGVDWNSYINGGQIVVVEYCKYPTLIQYYDDAQGTDVTIDFTGKFRLFYRKGIKAKESTQRNTREEIIRLMTTLHIDYVYVDYGAGDTNIEELSLYGLDHPGLNMSKKLKVIDSGASVEHYDPVLQRMVKKRNKSLMVSLSVLTMEEGLFLLPKEEDEKVRLIGQMRGYVIKNVTVRGDYTYDGEDHILDAFNLAIYGFQKEYGQLVGGSRVKFNIQFMNDPRLKSYPERQQDYTGPTSSNTLNLRDPEKPVKNKRFHTPTKAYYPGSRPNIEFGAPNKLESGGLSELGDILGGRGIRLGNIGPGWRKR